MNAEVHEIITPDGVTFDLSDGYARYVLRTPGQMGIPAVEAITMQAGQQGRLYRDFILQPRELELQIRYQGCNRSQYWQGRQELLNVLRPNRNGELWYSLTLEDGTNYMIRGIIAGTPFSAASDGWDEWGYTETLTIICNDPIWYGGDSTTLYVTGVSVTQLVFPITFPNVYFQENTNTGTTVSVTYTGTWYSYPLFRIQGAFSGLTLTHAEKGVSIRLNYGVGVDDYVVIDLENRLVYNSIGTDLFSYLGGESNLVDFRLEPDPVLTDGINTIVIAIDDAVFDPLARNRYMTYSNRYIGI